MMIVEPKTISATTKIPKANARKLSVWSGERQINAYANPIGRSC
jgi:hypothetical protein